MESLKLRHDVTLSVDIAPVNLSQGNCRALQGRQVIAQQRCLVCKGEVGVFEQMIHQDDQLPHDRRVRDFGGFALGDEDGPFPPDHFSSGAGCAAITLHVLIQN